MSVSLELPSALEAALRARAIANGQTVDAYVRQCVSDNLAQVVESQRGPRPAASVDELLALIDGISGRHIDTQGQLDDRRESIYAGCGE